MRILINCFSDRIVLRLLTAIALFGATAPLRAQEPEAFDVRHEVFAGGEVERYLRVLQLAGAARGQPWSVRPLSPADVERGFASVAEHPWMRRYRLSPDSVRGLRYGWVRPQVDAVYNSAFPHGDNDGAVWAGRGLTSAARAGGWVRYGPLSLVIAPVVFRAENTAFDLAPDRPLEDQFSDPRYPNAIDHPQRFGDGAYSRIDPGQSTLRLDLPVVAAGVSTANQVWGPGSEYPILLGNNAPGFAHLFLGTSAPLNIGIGRVHGRMVWGRLEQSRYSPVGEGEKRRFMSGFVGAFVPRWIPGLELGAARFFHTTWPSEGLSLDNFLKPLEGFLKVGLEGDGVEGNSDRDNQLASFFFRWAPLRTGFEVYGEYAREDHNYDLRDLLLEPDQNSAYMFGLSRAWTGSSERWIVLRGEVLNAEVSHLFRVRDQNPFYVHTFTKQGHTARGQILGSPAAYGGSGVHVAVDAYHPRGRWSLAGSRSLRNRRGTYWQSGLIERDAADVVYSLGSEALYFTGPFEVRGALTATTEFNRYFEDDAFNLNVAIGIGWTP